MTPPESLVAIAAKALQENPGPWTSPWDDDSRENNLELSGYADLARVVLGALLSASEVDEQFGTRLTWDYTEDEPNPESPETEDHWGDGTRKFAELRCETHRAKRYEAEGRIWAVSPTLIRRLHITTPVEVVEDAREETR